MAASALARLPPHPCSELLTQPHGVELVVEVVAGRDRPPLDVGAMGDDPMPLDQVDDVGLLVEESFLEGPEVLLALLEVGGPCLLLEEIVDDGVLVPAEVRVGLAYEARQIQIRLHDEAALEVHGNLEVSPLEHRV